MFAFILVIRSQGGGTNHIGVKVRTNAILLLIMIDIVVGIENQEGTTLTSLIFISLF